MCSSSISAVLMQSPNYLVSVQLLSHVLRVSVVLLHQRSHDTVAERRSTEVTTSTHPNDIIISSAWFYNVKSLIRYAKQDNVQNKLPHRPIV